MKTMTAALAPSVPEPSVDSADPTLRPDSIEVGQWFWVCSENRHDETYHWLGCVVYLGSNYAKIEAPRDHNSTSSVRVHFDEFYDVCTWVPNAQEVIAGYIAHHHSRLNVLMGRMQEATARLAITPSREMHANASDAQALSVSMSGETYGDYKAALVKAQKTELPAIFEEIKGEHESLAKWMSAALVPLKAQVGELSTLTDAIKKRIHNVELYAGLAEQIVEVRSGEPAPNEQAIRLIFDSDRALTPGAAPDFELYRAKLNRRIRAGTRTVGQRQVFEAAEKRKRAEYSERSRKHWRHVEGPPHIAAIAKWAPRTEKATFEWQRAREVPKPWLSDYVPISFTVESKYLLNVDAYKPGDFRIFYSDPRTRADYLEWAPFLLAAEEFHAGNATGKPDLRAKEAAEKKAAGLVCGACDREIPEGVSRPCPARHGHACAPDLEPDEPDTEPKQEDDDSDDEPESEQDNDDDTDEDDET